MHKSISQFLAKVTALSEEMCQKYADLADVALERMTGTPTHGYGCRVEEVGGMFVWLSGGETSDLQVRRHGTERIFFQVCNG